MSFSSTHPIHLWYAEMSKSFFLFILNTNLSAFTVSGMCSNAKKKIWRNKHRLGYVDTSLRPIPFTCDTTSTMRRRQVSIIVCCRLLSLSVFFQDMESPHLLVHNLADYITAKNNTGQYFFCVTRYT